MIVVDVVNLWNYQKRGYEHETDQCMCHERSLSHQAYARQNRTSQNKRKRFQNKKKEQNRTVYSLERNLDHAFRRISKTNATTKERYFFVGSLGILLKTIKN
ncbi:CLUMA_CG021151, isoform A [Clunio marinus]|uniref:CLUMA_CG021151, isoform A n=1 Tax=Clunio marinus TaxID=568069 RepID=A0A1J1J676_9DIPT|nr:CLUMA_CG021151, isoform A [Clunio marinus]